MACADTKLQCILNDMMPSVLEKLGVHENQVIDTHITDVPEQGAFMLNVPCVVTLKYKTNAEKRSNTDGNGRTNTGKINDAIEEYAFLAKVTFQNDESRKAARMDERFHRECLTYSMYIGKLPEVARQIFPKYLTGRFGSGSGDYIALEYLGKYEMGRWDSVRDRLFLPDDHIHLALHNLGVFHGAGYVLKEKDPDTYRNLAKHFDSNKLGSGQEFLMEVAREMTKKAYEEFKKVTNYNADVYQRLDGPLQDAWVLMQESMEPDEPLAIICHGDFNRNNLMYKYRDDRAIACKFIDLQFAPYANPAIDTTFLIFMNTTHEQRAKNFDKYLHTYHDALINTLRQEGVLNAQTSEKYSLEAFVTDISRRVLAIFATVAFFIPMSMEYADPKGNETRSQTIVNDTSTEIHKLCRKHFPNDTVTNCLRDIVERFYL